MGDGRPGGAALAGDGGAKPLAMPAVFVFVLMFVFIVGLVSEDGAVGAAEAEADGGRGRRLPLAASWASTRLASAHDSAASSILISLPSLANEVATSTLQSACGLAKRFSATHTLSIKGRTARRPTSAASSNLFPLTSTLRRPGTRSRPTRQSILFCDRLRVATFPRAEGAFRTAVIRFDERFRETRLCRDERASGMQLSKFPLRSRCVTEVRGRVGRAKRPAWWRERWRRLGKRGVWSSGSRSRREPIDSGESRGESTPGTVSVSPKPVGDEDDGASTRSSTIQSSASSTPWTVRECRRALGGIRRPRGSKPSSSSLVSV